MLTLIFTLLVCLLLCFRGHVDGRRPMTSDAHVLSEETHNVLNVINDEILGSISNTVSAASHLSAEGLIFRPATLVFADSPVCIPTVTDFYIDNMLEYEISIYSIVSDNTQFHPVLFQPQVLPPQHSISLQLLFLPYFVEGANATLTISSSEGDFEYSIQGTAVNNQYSINPIMGNRLPAGVSREQPIVLYNPFDEVLHVREVFTTEEFLSLQSTSMSNQHMPLPLATMNAPEGNGNNDANSGYTNPNVLEKSVSSTTQSNMWAIEPHSAREIITLTMSSKQLGEHHGYVHIKTNKEDIVLPVDLFVIEGGLSVFPEKLDFGVIPTADMVRPIDLYIVNDGTHDVTIYDIVPVEPDPSFEIEFLGDGSSYPILPAGTRTLVCRLLLYGHTARYIQNRLVIVTSHPNPALAVMEIPYTGNVMHGGLGFDDDDTLFFLPIQNETIRHRANLSDAPATANVITTENANERRLFPVTNVFSNAITIEEISVDSCGSFIQIVTYEEDQFPDKKKYFDSKLNKSSKHFEEISNEIRQDVSDVEKDEEADWIHLSLDGVVPSNASFPLTLNFNRLLTANSVWLPQHQKNSPDVDATENESENPYLELPFQCVLEIFTNVSTHRIPLYILDGSVELSFYDAETVDVKTYTEQEIHGVHPEDIFDVSGDMSLFNTTVEPPGLPVDGFDPLTNTNTYVIDIGKVARYKPKPALILVGNPHPFRIPLDVAYANVNISLCYISAWPRPSNIHSISQDLNSNAHPSYLTTSNSMEHNRNITNRNFALYHGANSVSIKVPNTSGEPHPQADKCIRYVAGSTVMRTMKHNLQNSVSRPVDEHIGSTSEHSGLYIEPFHTALVAVYINPPEWKQKWQEEFVKESQETVNVRPYAIEEDLRVVQLQLETPYQVLDLRLRIDGVKGRFISQLVKPHNATFILGVDDFMVIRTTSTFAIDNPVLSIASYTPHFRIKPIVHNLLGEYVPVNETDQRFVVEDGYASTIGLFPKQLCIEQPYRTINNCLKELIENVLLLNSTYSSYRDGYMFHNMTEQVGAGLLREGLEHLLARTVYFDHHITNKQYIDAYMEAIKIKSMWNVLYPHGYTLPPTEISLKTHAMHHTIHAPETRYLLPISKLPDVNKIKLPSVRMEQIVLFFLEVHNPFSVPISIHFVGNPLSGNQSNAKGIHGEKYVSSMRFWEHVGVQRIVKSLEKEPLDPNAFLKNMMSSTPVDANKFDADKSTLLSHVDGNHTYGCGGFMFFRSKAEGISISGVNGLSSKAFEKKVKMNKKLLQARNVERTKNMKNKKSNTHKNLESNQPGGHKARERRLKKSSSKHVCSDTTRCENIADDVVVKDDLSIPYPIGKYYESLNHRNQQAIKNSKAKSDVSSVIPSMYSLEEDDDDVEDEFQIVKSAYFKVRDLNLLLMSNQERMEILKHSKGAGFQVHPQLLNAGDVAIQPHNTGFLGPFAYIPAHGPPKRMIPGVYETGKHDMTVYLYNNFTGVDRIDISADSGRGRLGVSKVHRYASINPEADAMHERGYTAKRDFKNKTWGVRDTIVFDGGYLDTEGVALGNKAYIPTRSYFDRLFYETGLFAPPVAPRSLLIPSVGEQSELVVFEITNFGKSTIQIANVMVNGIPFCMQRPYQQHDWMADGSVAKSIVIVNNGLFAELLDSRDEETKRQMTRRPKAIFSRFKSKIIHMVQLGILYTITNLIYQPSTSSIAIEAGFGAGLSRYERAQLLTRENDRKLQARSENVPYVPITSLDYKDVSIVDMKKRGDSDYPSICSEYGPYIDNLVLAPGESLNITLTAFDTNEFGSDIMKIDVVPMWKYDIDNHRDGNNHDFLASYFDAHKITEDVLYNNELSFSVFLTRAEEFVEKTSVGASILSVLNVDLSYVILCAIVIISIPLIVFIMLQWVRWSMAVQLDVTSQSSCLSKLCNSRSYKVKNYMMLEKHNRNKLNTMNVQGNSGTNISSNNHVSSVLSNGDASTPRSVNNSGKKQKKGAHVKSQTVPTSDRQTVHDDSADRKSPIQVDISALELYDVDVTDIVQSLDSNTDSVVDTPPNTVVANEILEVNHGATSHMDKNIVDGSSLQNATGTDSNVDVGSSASAGLDKKEASISRPLQPPITSKKNDKNSETPVIASTSVEISSKKGIVCSSESEPSTIASSGSGIKENKSKSTKTNNANASASTGLHAKAPIALSSSTTHTTGSGKIVSKMEEISAAPAQSGTSSSTKKERKKGKDGVSSGNVATHSVGAKDMMEKSGDNAPLVKTRSGNRNGDNSTPIATLSVGAKDMMEKSGDNAPLVKTRSGDRNATAKSASEHPVGAGAHGKKSKKSHSEPASPAVSMAAVVPPSDAHDTDLNVELPCVQDLSLLSKTPLAGSSTSMLGAAVMEGAGAMNSPAIDRKRLISDTTSLLSTATSMHMNEGLMSDLSNSAPVEDSPSRPSASAIPSLSTDNENAFGSLLQSSFFSSFNYVENPRESLSTGADAGAVSLANATMMHANSGSSAVGGGLTQAFGLDELSFSSHALGTPGHISSNSSSNTNSHVKSTELDGIKTRTIDYSEPLFSSFQNNSSLPPFQKGHMQDSVNAESDHLARFILAQQEHALVENQRTIDMYRVKLQQSVNGMDTNGHKANVLSSGTSTSEQIRRLSLQQKKTAQYNKLVEQASNNRAPPGFLSNTNAPMVSNTVNRSGGLYNTSAKHADDDLERLVSSIVTSNPDDQASLWGYGAHPNPYEPDSSYDLNSSNNAKGNNAKGNSALEYPSFGQHHVSNLSGDFPSPPPGFTPPGGRRGKPSASIDSAMQQSYLNQNSTSSRKNATSIFDEDDVQCDPSLSLSAHARSFVPAFDTVGEANLAMETPSWLNNTFDFDSDDDSNSHTTLRNTNGRTE